MNFIHSVKGTDTWKTLNNHAPMHKFQVLYNTTPHDDKEGDGDPAMLKGRVGIR